MPAPHEAFPFLITLQTRFGSLIGAPGAEWGTGRRLCAVVRLVAGPETAGGYDLGLGTVAIQRVRVALTSQREPTPEQVEALQTAIGAPDGEGAVVRRSSLASVLTDEELGE